MTHCEYFDWSYEESFKAGTNVGYCKKLGNIECEDVVCFKLEPIRKLIGAIRRRNDA